jgi:outer membrane lipoprotein carrier protein
MLRKIMLLGFFFTVIGASAQNENVRKAQKILNQVSKSYKGLKSLKASFDITITEPGSKKPTQEKGILYLKNESFKVELPAVEIICNGTTQWYYMKDVNEVQVTDFVPDENEVSPSNIFTMYDKGFRYQWIEQKNEGGRVVDVIELIPKEKQETKEYTKIKLTVDKIAKEILSSEILFRSGRKMKYSISQQIKNINLATGFFEFDPAKHKGITVTDLR